MLTCGMPGGKLPGIPTQAYQILWGREHRLGWNWIYHLRTVSFPQRRPTWVRKWSPWRSSRQSRVCWTTSRFRSNPWRQRLRSRETSEKASSRDWVGVMLREIMVRERARGWRCYSRRSLMEARKDVSYWIWKDQEEIAEQWSKSASSCHVWMTWCRWWRISRAGKGSSSIRWWRQEWIERKQAEMLRRESLSWWIWLMLSAILLWLLKNSVIVWHQMKRLKAVYYGWRCCSAIKPHRSSWRGWARRSADWLLVSWCRMRDSFKYTWTISSFVYKVENFIAMWCWQVCYTPWQPWVSKLALGKASVEWRWHGLGPRWSCGTPWSHWLCRQNSRRRCWKHWKIGLQSQWSPWKNFGQWRGDWAGLQV